jgi:hypothetical protein
VLLWSHSLSSDPLGAPVVPLLSTIDGKQQLYLQLLRHGIALVFTTTVAFNKYSYMPSGHPFYSFKCDVSSPTQPCWAAGYNPDTPYLAALFDKVYTTEDYFLDSARMAIVGFGAGSKMTSRAMNSFPSMRTLHQVKFPNIQAAVLIGDGGMYCYAYDDDATLPEIFLPCEGANNLANKGCCARGLTETEYAMGARPYSLHPPVLLVHNYNNVSYGATEGSRLYYEAMRANGARACILEATDAKDTGSTLTMELCQVNPTLSFILLYLGVAPKSPTGQELELQKARDGTRYDIAEVEARLLHKGAELNARVHGRPWGT